MTNELYILFCESPFQANKVDESYEDQFLAAKRTGLETILFNFEDLTNGNEVVKATRRIKPRETMATVIYRGWMLTPQQYLLLYNNLIDKNYKMINTVEEYQNCHYLPDSLKYIQDRTPKTVFEKFDSDNSLDKLVEKASIFGQKPVILKDYVKSEKHDWERACFVADASNTEKLKQTIKNLIELIDRHLNEGIVVREFVELNALTIHSKSGMPLTEEYRLFFCNQKLVGICDYWEEGEYQLSKPDTIEFEAIAQEVESNFFSMDIARQKDGKWIIIELGDGQVAGLPDRADREEFYERVMGCF